MLGADYYQTESEIASLLAEGKVPIGIGKDSKIRLVFQKDLTNTKPLFSINQILSEMKSIYIYFKLGNASLTRMPRSVKT